MANRLMKKGNYEEAITLYEKALNKMPNSPEIFYNMGTAMTSIGDFNSASQLYDMAKKNFTDKTSKQIKSIIHYNAGINKIEMENYYDAINELVESLVNTPNDKNAKRALEYAQKRLNKQNNNNTGPITNNSEENQDGNNNEKNSDDNNNQNDSEQNQNDDNQEKKDDKSDINRLLESLRQFRKDKDNDDQYYGGGIIDKDW